MNKLLELGKDSKEGGYLFRANEWCSSINGISISPSFQRESNQVSEDSRV